MALMGVIYGACQFAAWVFQFGAWSRRCYRGDEEELQEVPDTYSDYPREGSIPTYDEWAAKEEDLSFTHSVCRDR